MVKHVVCFKLTENSPENCLQAQTVLKSMEGKVPSAKNIEVHINELHSPRSFDILLEVLEIGRAHV